MALRRFYIGPEALADETVSIRGDLLHHIKDVCRFVIGDRFELLNGHGEAWLVEVTSTSSKELLARRLSARQLPAPKKPHLNLCVSIPKLPKMDWIIEKSVELGVHSIRPFVSDYSFLRKVSEVSENRLQRWSKLVQGATQQSGRGDLMLIQPATTLKNLLAEFNRTNGAKGLFPYEGDARQGLSEALRALQLPSAEQVWVFVGSEGGFSGDEVRLFATSGMSPVSMGDQILRVETACVVLASIIKYENGELE